MNLQDRNQAMTLLAQRITDLSAAINAGEDSKKISNDFAVKWNTDVVAPLNAFIAKDWQAADATATSDDVVGQIAKWAATLEQWREKVAALVGEANVPMPLSIPGIAGPGALVEVEALFGHLSTVKKAGVVAAGAGFVLAVLKLAAKVFGRGEAGT